MTIYFAYGANMDPVHMADRCPGATRLGLAVLPDHEFVIARKGYGNASPAPGKDIPGVLWDLSADDEAALDEFEGVPVGMYRQEFVTVRTADRRNARAMLYRPADPGPGTPVPGYLEGIVAVAVSLGLPEEYVASLRRLIAGPHQP